MSREAHVRFWESAEVKPPAPLDSMSQQRFLYVIYVVVPTTARIFRWFAHHAQHLWTSGVQKAPSEQCGHHQKDDIEPGRVVPTNGFLGEMEGPFVGNEMQKTEYELDCQRRCGHGKIKGESQECRHLQSVVFAIDIENGQYDEIGEEEGDHAAEADAAAPQHGCQRNVAYRAYKGKHCDDGTDKWTPKLRQQRMSFQKKSLPEMLWHPGAEGTGDEQANRNVHPERGPIHHKEVADGRAAFLREHPLPDRAFMHAHVHRCVAFHAPGDALLSLCMRSFDELWRKKEFEQQYQNGDHQRAAGELG